MQQMWLLQNGVQIGGYQERSLLRSSKMETRACRPQKTDVQNCKVAYGQPSVRRNIVVIVTVSLSVEERISAVMDSHLTLSLQQPRT
jgi:hypothetical protein